jgi:hypothetical protein
MCLGASKGEDCSWEHKISHWRRWRFYVYQTTAGVLAALGLTISLSILTYILKRAVKPRKVAGTSAYIEKKSQ